MPEGNFGEANINVSGFGKIFKSGPDDKYGIRQFNPHRSEDTQRLRDMYRHPEAVKYTLTGSLPPAKLDKTIRDENKTKQVIFAVVDDTGEAVGMIKYRTDSSSEKLKKDYKIPQECLILELSVRKLRTEWPEAAKWIKFRENLPHEEPTEVAYYGLKQSIIRLNEMEKEIAGKMGKKPRPILITVYTDPENIAMEKTIIKTGFKKVAHDVYVDGEEDTWIYGLPS